MPLVACQAPGVYVEHRRSLRLCTIIKPSNYHVRNFSCFECSVWWSSLYELEKTFVCDVDVQLSLWAAGTFCLWSNGHYYLWCQQHPKRNSAHNTTYIRCQFAQALLYNHITFLLFSIGSFFVAGRANFFVGLTFDSCPAKKTNVWGSRTHVLPQRRSRKHPLHRRQRVPTTQALLNIYIARV